MPRGVLAAALLFSGAAASTLRGPLAFEPRRLDDAADHVGRHLGAVFVELVADKVSQFQIASRHPTPPVVPSARFPATLLSNPSSDPMPDHDLTPALALSQIPISSNVSLEFTPIFPVGGAIPGEDDGGCFTIFHPCHSACQYAISDRFSLAA